MREKSYVEDIDRSIYDFKDDEKDAYKVKAGLTPEIVQERFDDYWAVGENWPEASPDQPSDHERLVALEAAMVDMLLGGGDDDV